MGNLLRSCVKVREAIKLPFGEVSGVGRRVRILDGVYIWQGLVKVFLGVSLIGLNGVLSVFLKQKCTRLKREKLTVF